MPGSLMQYLAVERVNVVEWLTKSTSPIPDQFGYCASERVEPERFVMTSRSSLVREGHLSDQRQYVCSGVRLVSCQIHPPCYSI